MTVPYKQGMRYFDLYHGTELQAVTEGDKSVLEFVTEAHGYGAVLASPGMPDARIQRLLSKMRMLTEKPLADYSHEWKPLTQQLVEIPPTKPSSSAPEGMIRIDAANYVFKVEGIEIEGSDDVGVDVQYPWEDR